MKLWQLLKPKHIELDFKVDWPVDSTGEPLPKDKALWIIKERVIQELVELHDRSGLVQNKRKLFIDLLNREKKSTTGVGKGVAIPHVRTMQVKDVSVCFLRSKDGIEFEAIDGEPCHLFFSLVAPPYNDQIYLKFFKKIAQLVQYESIIEELRNAKRSEEIVRIIKENEQ